MNKQKGLAPILIILLIALAAGGYILYQKQFKLLVPQSTIQPSLVPTSSPSNNESTNSAETANWKTYTNNTYGFEVKYPTAWKVEQKKSNLEPNYNGKPTYAMSGECSPYILGAIDKGIAIIDDNDHDGEYDEQNFIVLETANFFNNSLIYDHAVMGDHYRPVHLDYLEKVLNGDMVLADKVFEDTTFPKDYIDRGYIMITNFAGRQAFYEKERHVGPCNTTAKENFALYEFLRDGKYISILVRTEVSQSTLFDQILSTFRFN